MTMAEIGRLKVVMPVWRIRICTLACVVLSPFPMPDRWAQRIMQRLVDWSIAGLVVVAEVDNG